MNSIRKKNILLLLLSILFVTAYTGKVIILNPGCKQFDSSGKCSACSTRFYKDKEGICQPVNPNCRDYNPSNGACTSCYDGFSIIEDTCLPKSHVDSLIGLYEEFANCNELGNDGKCKKCSTGFYFDEKKICKKIPDTCANFNIKIGECTGCYPGYGLNSKKQCVINIQGSSDPGCNKFDKGKCVKCSFGYYFDPNKKCKVIPPTCQNFDQVNSRCNRCYPGFQLDSKNNCVQASPVPVDPGCSKFEKGICIKCSFGYYFNKEKVCKLSPSSCSDFNAETQTCRACYSGYTLNKDKQCVQSAQGEIDEGCSKFDKGVCSQCSFGYYFNKLKKCKLIPSTCNKFDTQNEKCSLCYSGFKLDDNNNCIESVQQLKDSGCFKFESGICVKCSVGYYFDKLKKCKLIPASCKRFEQSKQWCNECYEGYDLDEKKNCIEKTQQKVKDLGCSRFEKGICMSCSKGYFFNDLGVCQQIPSTCSQFDPLFGVCKQCYNGYELNEKKECVEKKPETIDLNCKQFKNAKCVQCSSGAFLDMSGNCALINPHCKKFNHNQKKCEQCYSGFSLNAQKSCTESPAGSIDPNCKKIKNNECEQCSFRFFKGLDGICKSVNPSCRLYNSENGQCTGCYDGFKLQNKKCEIDVRDVSDINCAQWKNGKCSKCSYGSFFSKAGLCTLVDSLCLTWNDQNGDCKTCYPSFQLKQGKCILKKGENFDANCAKFGTKGECLRCSKGFYFNQKNFCIQVDPLCSSFDSQFSRCLTCYLGYKISNGKCVQDTQTLSDLHCAQFKNSICVRCSTGFFFDKNKKCKQIDPQCRWFDNDSLKCKQCYPGYVLFNDDCVVSSKDNLCAQWKQGICLKCASRGYFNDHGSCSQVSQYCKDFNIFDGQCQSCYSGFELKKGKCHQQKQSNGCIQYSKDSKCLRCEKRKYLNNGECSKVDDLCEQFDYFKKQCIRCYSGYQVADQKCVLAEVKSQQEISNCYIYSLKGDCVECYDRFYLQDNSCNQVSVFCKKYDKNNGKCTQCYTGFILENGSCNRK